jgi:hypothetical protein
MILGVRDVTVGSISLKLEPAKNFNLVVFVINEVGARTVTLLIGYRG